MTGIARYLSLAAPKPRKPRAKPVRRELPVQARIIAAIAEAYPHIEVRGIDAAGKRALKQQQNMKRQGIKPGTPDILCIFEDGRHGWIEVKTDTKNVTESSLNEHQKGFRDLCKARNIPWIACNSVSAALDFCEVYS